MYSLPAVTFYICAIPITHKDAFREGEFIVLPVALFAGYRSRLPVRSRHGQGFLKHEWTRVGCAIIRVSGHCWPCVRATRFANLPKEIEGAPWGGGGGERGKFRMLVRNEEEVAL